MAADGLAATRVFPGCGHRSGTTSQADDVGSMPIAPAPLIRQRKQGGSKCSQDVAPGDAAAPGPMDGY